MNVTQTVAGLRALADFLEANPELPDPYYLRDPNVWCPETPEEVEQIVRAAGVAGVEVRQHQSESQRNIGLWFGPVEAMALINKAVVEPS